MRLTVPRYVWPTSASAVKPRIRFTAASAASPLAVAIEIVPSSDTSIFAPVSSTRDRMTLPPGPMTSRILSGLIRSWMIRGACAEISSRVDAGDLDVHLKRRDSVACASAPENHVAVEIFGAGNVRQNRVLVTCHHEP